MFDSDPARSGWAGLEVQVPRRRGVRERLWLREAQRFVCGCWHDPHPRGGLPATSGLGGGRDQLS